MAGELLYAFRIMRLPLLDAGGAAIGRVDDIVVIQESRPLSRTKRWVVVERVSGGGAS